MIKAIIEAVDGTCYQCDKKIVELYDGFFCSKKCSDEMREWVIIELEKHAVEVPIPYLYIPTGALKNKRG
jgi:hypothetical protein